MYRNARRVLVALLMLTGYLSVASPASAGVAQAYVKVTKPYVSNWVFRSTPLAACMLVEVAGAVTGTRRYAYYASDGGWDPRFSVWSGVKMVNPRVTMKTGAITSAGCDFTRPVRFSQAELRQEWYEGGCRMSAGISVGFPWTVSASPTYTCGNYSVAKRTTMYATGPSFEQNNTGAPVYYRGEKLAGAGDAIPFRANVRVTGYRTVGGVARSDTFVTSRGVAFLKR